MGENGTQKWKRKCLKQSEIGLLDMKFKFYEHSHQMCDMK